ncbi:PrgI family protein [Streptomyces sp. NPDC021622]|uniref:PrgI family protein n=1 Tax=Streptomyces sp. NPDC021622 TaxID=3155013 RepID=UPI0033FD1002
MTQPVRIPADVDHEDTVLGNLNARQLLILALTGAVLYGFWSLTRSVVPLPVVLLVALPFGGVATLLALGSRDGLSLDRLALAAVRQRMAPSYRVAASEGFHPSPAWLRERANPAGHSHDPTLSPDFAPAQLRLPAEDVSEAGVVDLGTDGVALVAICGTVNFALRTPTEQEALVSSFGRYLHSLTSPVQILIRAERLDLSSQISELREYAPQLPHRALETAAHEHAQYLGQLAREADLLRRQVLLVLREPVHSAVRRADELDGASPLSGLALRKTRSGTSNRRFLSEDHAQRRAAESRLAQRLTEAAELLGPIGIVVAPLDSAQATAVLTAACNPDSLVPPSPASASSWQVITGTPEAGAEPYEAP